MHRGAAGRRGRLRGDRRRARDSAYWPIPSPCPVSASLLDGRPPGYRRRRKSLIPCSDPRSPGLIERGASTSLPSVWSCHSRVTWALLALARETVPGTVREAKALVLDVVLELAPLPLARPHVRRGNAGTRGSLGRLGSPMAPRRHPSGRRSRRWRHPAQPPCPAPSLRPSLPSRWRRIGSWGAVVEAMNLRGSGRSPGGLHDESAGLRESRRSHRQGATRDFYRETSPRR